MKRQNVILIMILIATFVYAQTDKKMSAEYLKALEALQQKDTTSAREYFLESIRQNHDDASYFELSKIYWRQKDFLMRNKAYEYMKTVVMKNENNIEYKYFYAEICKSFARNESVTQWEDILKIDASQIKAMINLADYFGDEYVEWIKSVRAVKAFESPERVPMSPMPGTRESGERLSERFIPGGKPIHFMPLQNYSEKDFFKALDYYKQALRIDSTNYDLCLKIGLFCAESGKPLNGIPPLNRLDKLGKADNKVYQCLGLLYYKANNLKESFMAYQKALELMPSSEQEDFTLNSVKFILSTGNSSLNDLDRNQLASYINQYWKLNDPLLLTDYNERLLEHYSRIAFANLSFSLPGKNIPGWKTDRGEIYLRYGEPLSRIRIRPNLTGGMGPGPDRSKPNGADEIMSKTIKGENWRYPDFEIRFEDPYQNGNYQFDNSQLILVEDLRKSKPSTFYLKSEGPIFDLSYNSYQFASQNKGMTDIYLSYCINFLDTATTKDKFVEGCDIGLIMLDKGFNKYYSYKNTITFPDITENYSINSLKISSPPQYGNLAFEMIRKKDKGVTAYHGKYTVKDYSGEELKMSDVVLALQVETNQDIIGSIKRNNISVLPNPDRTFNKNEQLNIYFEIYNLTRNANNTTDFEQRISIQKKEEGGVLGSLLGVVGLDKKGEKVSLTSKYQTQEKDPQMYLQLDMSKYEPGEYVLTVMIKDNINGKEVSGSTEIKWE